MSGNVRNALTWLAGILLLGLAGLIGSTLPHGSEARTVEAAPGARQAPASGGSTKAAFAPPPESAIPDDEFGKMVRLGESIFRDTQEHAKQFVGNDLRCSNCHLDGGRLANSAPLWAAYVAFPAYREKDRRVSTFAERLQECFLYSMNGKAPPLGDKVLVALQSYSFFLAKGAPVGESLPGRGYPKLPEPAKLNYARGQQIYAEKCAFCHGADGQGRAMPDGQIVFPPLWGERSYNWGAGMSSIDNAAGFIKATMPFGEGNTLSDEDAWAVATFIDSQERPQDPRFNGSVAETRKEYHDSRFSMYGQTVNGVVLGEHSPPSGPIPR